MLLLETFLTGGRYFATTPGMTVRVMDMNLEPQGDTKQP